MNILAITKFPPIQGGESSSAFFLFDELARRGHTVTVLTNSEEVLPKDRVCFAGGDSAVLSANPNVTIRNVGNDPMPEFIPQYDPKTEKLLNEGIKILSSDRFHVVFGWYLLPYVSAAFLLSEMFQLPLVLQHAGSDLTRIYPKKSLNNYFDTIITRSAGIVTYAGTSKYFDKESGRILEQNRGFPDIFSIDGSQVDFQEEFNIACDSETTFLCLGKFTRAKGFYEIVEAFRRIGSAKLVIFSPNRRRVCLELPTNVFMVDAVAPWRVPAIIRSAKAVIVPEWDFGVPAHKSNLPLESILCGKTAIVSSQIVANYGALQDFMVPIRTPDIDDTVAKITRASEDATLNDKLRTRYGEIRRSVPTLSSHVDKVESFLRAQVAHPPAARSSKDSSDPC